MRLPTFVRPTLPLLLALAAPTEIVAQVDAKPEPAASKLAEWPPLKQTDTDRVLALVGQFRKEDPELHAEARKQLLAIGDGAMPLLMQQVSDRTENINTDLFALFDTMLEPRHSALMARETKKPRTELRRYLVRRLCRFGDASLLPVLQTTSKDKDEATAFYASLGMLALKRREAVPAVLAYTKTQWKDVGPLVAEVLPAARSLEVGNWVCEAIAKANAADQMAGLRLLRYLGVKEHQLILRTYLQAPDHTVKKEAINTMRVMHGQEPIENLTVFQAIEMAKEWLQK
ncbi:MAG TPA: hypothetical protein VFZ65_19235 [Planctomycetota bacterium]|nr:hypothetical protein [Planctomycetota bacterium]